MNALEVLDIISSGETSRVQFKERITDIDKFANEMVAMSNSMGGMILIGVKDKTGDIVGLDYKAIRKIGNLASDVATNNIVPQIYIETEAVTIETEDEKKGILIIYVREGVNKPYKNTKQVVWIKQGSDNRRVTDNFEMLRLFQSGGNLLADEMEVLNTSIKDVDEDKVRAYFLKVDSDFETMDLTFDQALKNINVIRNGQLTLGGLLFFGKNPQNYKPTFHIKAVSFFGNAIEGTQYRNSQDISGAIPELYQKGLNFFISNLKHTQQGQSFNSLGILEVSKIALEETLQNALVHRDYFKNSPIRLLIFDNRIEIVSPGKLPNNLTVENIKLGNIAVRNNLLASYCAHAMPYRGLGSGIKRAIKEQPNIDFFNDVDGEQFIVKIPRPEVNS